MALGGVVLFSISISMSIRIYVFFPALRVYPSIRPFIHPQTRASSVWVFRESMSLSLSVSTIGSGMSQDEMRRDETRYE
jgi:hypothetical protein